MLASMGNKKINDRLPYAPFFEISPADKSSVTWIHFNAVTRVSQKLDHNGGSGPSVVYLTDGSAHEMIDWDADEVTELLQALKSEYDSY